MIRFSLAVSTLISTGVMAAPTPMVRLHSAQIDDPDGYTNVRRGPGGRYAVVTKIKRGQTFLVAPTKTPWWPVRIAGRAVGFIHKSRVKAGKAVRQAQALTLVGGKLYGAWMRFAPFDKTKHELGYSKTGPGEPPFLERVDGRRAYGIDGNLPRQEISRVELVIAGKTVELAPKHFRDCFEPAFYSTTLAVKRGRVVLVGQFSDGAGAYTVRWQVSAKGQRRSIRSEADGG